jgi:hypothetical protein
MLLNCSHQKSRWYELASGKAFSISSVTGNHEQEFIDLTPVGSAIEHHSKSTPCHGYREGDFGAVKELLSYSSTVDCLFFLFAEIFSQLALLLTCYSV